LGFVAVILSVNANTKSLRANVENSLVTHVINLNRLNIDKPFLHPYFDEGKVPDPNDPHYGEILATAQMVANILDLASIQSLRYRDQWENPEAWDAWVTDSLRNSPILVKYLRAHPKWYGDALRDKMNQVVPQTSR
jgi:hypothetical protein